MRRNRRRFGHTYHFISKYEERKSIECVCNIIVSPFAGPAMEELLEICGIIIGKDRLLKMVVREYPAIKPEGKKIGYGVILDQLDRGDIVSLLRHTCLPLLEQKLSAPLSAKETVLEKRLRILAHTLNLSEIDIELIILYYVSEDGPLFRLLQDGTIIDISNKKSLMARSHIVLGRKRQDVNMSFMSGRLFETGIIREGANLRLDGWCANYLAGIGNDNITNHFYSKQGNIDLLPSDFDITEDEKQVLDVLLKSENGFNLLLYGEPGTGKTSLAYSLGKAFNKTVFSVKTTEEDTPAERRRAIIATVLAANSKDTLIIIDEADEILATDMFLFDKPRSGKAWLNTLLDSKDRKIIWITNNYQNIHQSTMRRFNFSIKFGKLDHELRRKILQRTIEKSGLGALFPEDTVRELAKEFSVDAGGIVHAVKTIETEAAADKEAAMRLFRAVLKHHESAVHGEKRSSEVRKDFSGYSLSGLNCSEDPKMIVSAAKNYLSSGMSGQRPLSILLYGLPGTGKSEFVHYLGRETGRDVDLKRCSEIQSMWVGQTEKHIADAFRDASKNGHILFFDEADSFLFPRASAAHSWEKNFTNELLSQLDAYTGVVIFATNDIDGLDHAALRRFRLKVEFRPLSAVGVLELYRTMLLKYLPENERDIPAAIQSDLAGLRNLTPGDFSVVRDNLMFAEGEPVTHERLKESLRKECSYKPDSGRIGFGRCA